MKKLGIWLFILFLLFAGAYALMQSNIGRNWTRNLISNALQQSGYEVTIDQIEGTLPHQIDLKGIAIHGNGADIAIAELKLRPILWRLIQKELAFTDIHAKEISISKNTPFDFDGKVKINDRRAIVDGHVFDWKIFCRFDRNRKVAQFSARNPLLNLKGAASFDADQQFSTANIQLSSDQLLAKLPLPAAGRILSNVIVTREQSGFKGRFTWQIPNLIVDETRLGAIKGKGEAIWLNQMLKGELTAEPFAKATFDLAIGPLITGTTEFTIENLQSLHIPKAYGKLAGKAIWGETDNIQKVSFDITANDFYYGPFFAQRASLYSDLKDPFHNLTGLFDIEVEKGRWNDLELETATLETVIGEENRPFRLFAEGEWEHPLEVHMDGTWKDHFSANIKNFNGTFFNHPFTLENPVAFEITEKLFRLPNVQISIAGATAFIHIDRQGDDTDARIRFDHLPLDFLSLNPLDVSVTGTINLQAVIHEKNNRLDGDLKATIEQMEVATLGSVEKLSAAGHFDGQFNRDLLKLTGNLLVGQQPILNLDLSIPIQFSIWPFEAHFLTHKNAKGALSFNGRIEDFLDFFNIGPHRLEGQCNGTLGFSNTLSRPLLEGKLLFQDGFYQNYYTGTELHNIQADFFAEKNIVFLRSLTAHDAANTGSLTANGEIHLLQSDLYPFQFDVNLENLHFVEIDLVNAAANGNVHIEGNALSAIAKGDIHVVQSELTIPDHIPRPLPNLQVTYRNSVHPIAPPQTEYHPYPLSLDLNVLSPQPISISGRGLTSTWRGDFHLGGTYTSLATQGKLELIEGEFNFSSRTFKLTDGSLSLSGAEHEMPYLNLAGTTETQGITITARLKGPLDNPQITLQSTPPLPLGSIMSYLLFGQDISDLGGFQALQLATSLASLAGTGPDIMESTRRSLGIDRLRVIADPNSENGETVALQVGKYVAKGVLVTFTQGTEESSTNISVEVELKHNFVFQVESDQHQEQGKFTLKWNLNY